MSRARNLADLLDSNGDVVSGALDNVPPSNDASALTTGTLPIARIADGDVTTAKLASTLDLSGKTVTLPSGTGGKVLQVVQGTKSSSSTITSTSYVDIGLEVTITPSSATSKILVMVNINTASSNTGTGKYLRLYRSGTNIGNGGWGAGGEGVAIGDYCPAHGNSQASHGYFFLDSPSTTSATTYKFMGRVTGNTLYINRASGSGPGYAEPLSTITVMEIAA